MVLFIGSRVAVEVARGLMSPAPPALGPFVTRMRAWPMDCDIFLHLNNAMLARCAELARWRLLASTGMLRTVLREKWQFLVAEQTLTYKRQIPLGRRFRIETSVSATDNKWLHYSHNFQSLDGATDLGTAHVRAVLKLSSGKTVPPHDALRGNAWFADQLARSSEAAAAEQRAGGAAAPQ
mmetsp:Transcript_13944/g.42176  ORF Transcript_13944/g.42176 Transcript_13944/m.42176 type:complete len:180 (+) Transcript_13944:80-619(+)|eukprot:CAMPEP_0198646076 /NCGR_PEP_ID=MMETSP1467-20131203/1629_1 /TAXON_ID=1462469 /ORGANISM="unid. sp., Strain CCMP2135" /LENGTH=179 /DNA_ID=CAMNT_0044381589 /DNA_START=69 /DNA_END=608 /DNA_ORIENTATION=-